MKRVWKLCVCPDPCLPDTASSYAFAETAEEARALAGDPLHLFVHEKHPDMLWPGAPGEVLDWTKPPRLEALRRDG